MNLRRLNALIAKERNQLLRDKSSIIVGLLLPVILLLIFGYGMSMDIDNIKLVIVQPEPSKPGNDIVARFRASKFFITSVVRNYAEGTAAVRDHQADACLYLPQKLPHRLATERPEALVAGNATNSSRARIIENYVKSILLQAAPSVPGQPRVVLRARMWFNDANDSRYFMIPGVIVIIMSMIGTKLTSMLMAKEYEHGNMESMFATPMSAAELLLAKAVNNFLLGMLGLGISLLFACCLFQVPIRGSLWLLVAGSGLYLLMALATGLLLSSITKNQFVASQLSLVISFMPVFLLSGFLYEIPNMPLALQYVTYAIPARYYVDFLQTVFLVGDVWSTLLPDLAALTLFTIGLMALAWYKNPKKLEG